MKTRSVIKSRQSFVKIIFSLIVFLLSAQSDAEDSVDALMQRMQSDTAVRIAYRETRTIELMDQPWQGAGFMYSLPPDLMIKEQLQPERLLMAINGEQMFYFDPGNDIRHQGELNPDDPLTLSTAVFKALMNADRRLLESLYSVDFEAKPDQWQMTLSARNDTDSAFRIDISGLPEQQADRIQVQQGDGDKSDFILQKEDSGEDVAARINTLYQELLGTDD